MEKRKPSVNICVFSRGSSIQLVQGFAHSHGHGPIRPMLPGFLNGPEATSVGHES